ncbi:conserved hypothetical protein [Ricinus communis]|uniref:Uncharacterized protein n=1 Tax=Ricinus communis TaxID=3988 RepID=B9RHL0_RICCO|nr:conserved hypothetical protein [Ricinus communis]
MAVTTQKIVGLLRLVCTPVPQSLSFCRPFAFYRTILLLCCQGCQCPLPPKATLLIFLFRLWVLAVGGEGNLLMKLALMIEGGGRGWQQWLKASGFYRLNIDIVWLLGDDKVVMIVRR